MKRRITDYFNKQGVNNDSEERTDENTTAMEETSAETNNEGTDNLAPEQSSDSVKKSKKFEHHFQQSWLQTYTWLEYETSLGLMYCKTCRDMKKENALTTGTNCFRTSTLKRHVTCTDHQHALRELCMKDNFAIASKNAFAQKNDAVIAAMRCVYWLAKEGVSTVKYKSLLEFCKLQGCDKLQSLDAGKNATYTSWMAAEDIQDAICSVIQSDIDKQLSEAQYCAVMIDESTDITVSKKLVVYSRIVDQDMCQHTFFLGNIRIDEPSVTASVIYKKLQDYLASRGIVPNKIFGFGSDGASIMVGKKKGVATLLKQENPHLVSVHCFAHRLALCTSKAADNVSYIKTFDKTLSEFFYYFKHSTKRLMELKAIQKVLESAEIKPKEVHDVRWFSFYNALHAIYLSWKPLVTYFKSIEKPSQKEKDFLTSLTDVKFLSAMHMLMDVIPAFTQLNILFQKENIDIAAVPAALEGTLNSAKCAKDGKSYYQTEFKDRMTSTKRGDKTTYTFKGVEMSNKSIKDAMTEFKEIRSKFIDGLIQNVEKRFPKESTEIVFAFSVLGMRPLSFLSSEEWQQYGEKEMRVLTDFYGMDQKSQTDKKSDAIIQTERCLTEWSMVKKIVLEQKYPSDSLAILWKLIAEHHSDTFPNLMKLGKLALLMPLQTADCERGFSAQNNIHTPSRNALKPETLQRLMTIKIEGPDTEQFDFQKAVQTWTQAKDRRLFKK